MTFNTVDYIHQLLRDHKTDVFNKCTRLLEAREQAENEKADTYPSLCKAVEEAMDKLQEADIALKEFEDEFGFLD